MELNLSSCMVLTRALVPQMKERRWGRVIHISSIMGLGGKSSRNVYNATKHGLIGLSKANALDLGSYKHYRQLHRTGSLLDGFAGVAAEPGPEGRVCPADGAGALGRVEELIGPALLLATEAGSYITGETLVVDGGVMVNTL